MSRIEKEIMLKTLTGELPFDVSQRAMADPAAFKVSTIMSDGRNVYDAYLYWGKIKTQRLRIGYCWSKHKNQAGYYVAWREHYDANGKVIRRDQWTSRKVKKKLKMLQLMRSKELLDKGATTTPRSKSSIAHWYTKYTS